MATTYGSALRGSRDLPGDRHDHDLLLADLTHYLSQHLCRVSRIAFNRPLSQLSFTSLFSTLTVVQ